ncbi:calphotin-like [Zingiber officinale]|uniref:calphotin-like n=1 Tax=Zingiber officinale TaxID=94328 RepID=UPI001C4D2E89|nr:calphotin-like [Zingiber officinale]
MDIEGHSEESKCSVDDPGEEVDAQNFEVYLTRIYLGAKQRHDNSRRKIDMTHTRILIMRRGRPRKRAIDSPETESLERSTGVEPVCQEQTPQGIVSTSGYQTLMVPTSEVPVSIVPPVVPPSVYSTPPPSAVPAVYPATSLAVPATIYLAPQIPVSVTTYSAPVPAVLVAPYPVASTVSSVAPTYVYSVVPPSVLPIGSTPVVLPSSSTIPTDIVAVHAWILALAESGQTEQSILVTMVAQSSIRMRIQEAQARDQHLQFIGSQKSFGQ